MKHYQLYQHGDIIPIWKPCLLRCVTEIWCYRNTYYTPAGCWYFCKYTKTAVLISWCKHDAGTHTTWYTVPRVTLLGLPVFWNKSQLQCETTLLTSRCGHVNVLIHTHSLIHTADRISSQVASILKHATIIWHSVIFFTFFTVLPSLAGWNEFIQNALHPIPFIVDFWSYSV